MAGNGEGPKVLKPSACKSHMRKRLAESFDEIVDGFVKEAKKGSCPHVKLTNELLETASGKRASRKKGPAERMLEKWTGGGKETKTKRAQARDGKFVKAGSRG